MVKLSVILLKDVEIERPIDQEEAEEVGEEGAATLSNPQPQATTHHGQVHPFVGWTMLSW